MVGMTIQCTACYIGLYWLSLSLSLPTFLSFLDIFFSEYCTIWTIGSECEIKAQAFWPVFFFFSFSHKCLFHQNNISMQVKRPGQWSNICHALLMYSENHRETHKCSDSACPAPQPFLPRMVGLCLAGCGDKAFAACSGPDLTCCLYLFLLHGPKPLLVKPIDSPQPHSYTQE